MFVLNVFDVFVDIALDVFDFGDIAFDSFAVFSICVCISFAPMKAM